MKRCVIFCAGESGLTDFEPAAGDIVLCCDAGYFAARAMGIVPDLLLGDFDSFSEPVPVGIETQRFPVEKDDTDSMLAVREGLRRGCTQFVLLFSLGGRLDHTFANIQTLAFLQKHGADGILIGPRDTVRLLQNGKLTLPKREGYTLSVFSFGGQARGVTLTGVQYPLTDATVDNFFPIGVGNHILAPVAEIMVDDGTLLVIQSKIL